MTSRPPLRLFADTEWLNAPPPPQLIEGRVPAGALVMLFGPPGSLKTFKMISLATAVASAADWLGHRITDGGPCVYCVGEGHAAFPLRLQAVRTAHGLRDDEPSGVFYVREPVTLMVADDVTWLLDSIATGLNGERVRLVVFDPLTAFLAGGDENLSADMAVVVAALNRIRLATGATVIVTHHVGWNAERERGSTVLRGAMDVMYAVKADDDRVTVECVKMRDGTPPPPLHLQLVARGESCVVELAEAPATESVTRLTPRQQHVLDTVRTIVIDEPVSYSRWRDAAGAAETTFDRTLALLVRSGYVLKVGKGRSARYAPPGPLPPTPTSPPHHPHGGDPLTPTNPHTPLGVGVGGEGWGST